jgi:hypothetical protein
MKILKILHFQFIKKFQTCFQTMQIMHMSFKKECTISMQDINGSRMQLLKIKANNA